MRWILFVAMVLTWSGLASAADVAIYTGSAEVASQSDGDRDNGTRAAFRAALVKASGDARLASDPALGPVLARAASLARQFTYRESAITAADGSAGSHLAFVRGPSCRLPADLGTGWEHPGRDVGT
jgi:hypothetical protein